MSIVVSADVNNLTANASEILSNIRTTALPEITSKFGLKSVFKAVPKIVKKHSQI